MQSSVTAGSRRIAVMQPYLFPYLGYFQLIAASDVFVFYDDVTFIKGGWINRNRILLRGTPHRFTVPLANASSNTLIKDVRLAQHDRWYSAFRQTLEQAYRTAPHFEAVDELVRSVFEQEHTSIADLAISSVRATWTYLGEHLAFHRSSDLTAQTSGLDRSDRLIAMARHFGCCDYVNPAGGSDLYDRSYFADRGVRLHLLEAELARYEQGGCQEFVPGLSILDVLMFNDVADARRMITRFTTN